MDHEVDVRVDDGLDVDADAVLADACALLAAAADGPSELSVWLTTDAEIQALNATWRGTDAPTDVLSFPQQEGRVSQGLLGDLVISVPTAAAQAAEVGHDLATELRVLLAHGLAHLLGLDHDDDAATAEMTAVEARLLAALGVGTAGLVERAHGAR